MRMPKWPRPHLSGLGVKRTDELVQNIERAYGSVHSHAYPYLEHAGACCERGRSTCSLHGLEYLIVGLGQ